METKIVFSAMKKKKKKKLSYYRHINCFIPETPLFHRSDIQQLRLRTFFDLHNGTSPSGRRAKAARGAFGPWPFMPAGLPGPGSLLAAPCLRSPPRKSGLRLTATVRQ